MDTAENGPCKIRDRRTGVNMMNKVHQVNSKGARQPRLLGAAPASSGSGLLGAAPIAAGAIQLRLIHSFEERHID